MINQDLRQIEPAVGLGELRLGTSGIDVIGWLGESKDMVPYCVTGQSALERWGYREHELFVVINLAWDRVVQITTWDTGDKLRGRPLIGRSLPVVINELAAQGMHASHANTHANRRLAEYELILGDHGLSVFFEHGRCEMVSVYPIEIDGNPVWPD